MRYKGYEAAINFEEADDCFVGRVVNIEGPTAIVFDAQSVCELKVEFHASIDSYLKFCKNPKPPTNGKMTIRMTPQVHAGVLAMARTQGMSANKFVNQTLEQKLHL